MLGFISGPMQGLEWRYHVIKLSDMTPKQARKLDKFLEKNRIRLREAVVCEAHWPMFPQVKDLILYPVSGAMPNSSPMQQPGPNPFYDEKPAPSAFDASVPSGTPPHLPCLKAPWEWSCTRSRDHEGPCALVPCVPMPTVGPWPQPQVAEVSLPSVTTVANSRCNYMGYPCVSECVQGTDFCLFHQTPPHHPAPPPPPLEENSDTMPGPAKQWVDIPPAAPLILCMEVGCSEPAKSPSAFCIKHRVAQEAPALKTAYEEAVDKECAPLDPPVKPRAVPCAAFECEEPRAIGSRFCHTHKPAKKG